MSTGLSCDFYWYLQDGREMSDGWKPGDPCAACGSTRTGWNVEQGGFCLGCGRSDGDDD